MTEETKAPPIDANISDEHTAGITVPNFHCNVLEMIQDAGNKFKTQTGKEPKYLYAPGALLWLADRAVKARMKNAGGEIPDTASVVQLFGMDMIEIPGTCVTVTSDPLHDVSDTQQNAPSTKTVN